MSSIDSSIVVCAWCDRMRAGPLTWRPVDPSWLVQAGQEVTHGICPRCKAELLRQVADMAQTIPGVV